MIIESAMSGDYCGLSETFHEDEKFMSVGQSDMRVSLFPLSLQENQKVLRKQKNVRLMGMFCSLDKYLKKILH